MALVKINCHSESLGMAISFHAIVPQSVGTSQIGMASSKNMDFYPVLYLLHGLSDDDTIWCRRTSLERYAADKNIVIVMPNVHRSYYTNMVNGLNYWDFIVDELPQLARLSLPVSTRKQDSFVAGLSMGGYGAFKLALNYPERFTAAASLSGALDSRFMLNLDDEHRIKEWHNIFGEQEQWQNSPNDLLSLLDKHSKNKTDLPKLWMHCGTEDFLYDHNVKFKNLALSNNIDLEYHEGPGDHNWDVWDEQIQNVLNWLPLDNG